MKDANPSLRHPALLPSLVRYHSALWIPSWRQQLCSEHFSTWTSHYESLLFTTFFKQPQEQSFIFDAKDAPQASGLKHVGKVYQPSCYRDSSIEDQNSWSGWELEKTLL